MTTIRPAPFFIADHRGLDFLNTVAVPVDVKVEWLASGEDLLTWLGEARLVPDDVLKRFRSGGRIREVDAIAAQARSLRDWFKQFIYRHMAAPLQAQALTELEPLNRLLATDAQIARIVPREKPAADGHRGEERRAREPAFALEQRRRWEAPDSLLLPLALSLADLVCNEDLTHVRACEGPACTLLFMDRTRGRRRRWCSMAVCGNRTKQAAYRARVRPRREGVS